MAVAARRRGRTRVGHDDGVERRRRHDHGRHHGRERWWRRGRARADHRPRHGPHHARSVAGLLRHVPDLPVGRVPDAHRRRSDRPQEAVAAPRHEVGGQRRQHRLHVHPRPEGGVRRRLAGDGRRRQVLVGAPGRAGGLGLLPDGRREVGRGARRPHRRRHVRRAELGVPEHRQRAVHEHLEQGPGRGQRGHARCRGRRRAVVPRQLGRQRPVPAGVLRRERLARAGPQRQLLGHHEPVPEDHAEAGQGRHRAAAAAAAR